MKQTKDMHEEIKELTGRRSNSQSRCIRSNNGEMLKDENDILDRWTE